MFRVDFRRQSRVLRWGLAAVYLPVTAVYAVIWFIGACFYYGVACAFYTRVGWAHASRAAWSMTCDALFFACLIGVNLVAVAVRLVKRLLNSRPSLLNRFLANRSFSH